MGAPRPVVPLSAPVAADPVWPDYAYPEPPGYRTAPPGPQAARFDAALGEFVLPYTGGLP